MLFVIQLLTIHCGDREIGIKSRDTFCLYNTQLHGPNQKVMFKYLLRQISFIIHPDNSIRKMLSKKGYKLNSTAIN